MPELSTFFKESDTSLGIFYPLHYIVASFPSEEAASQAYDAVRTAVAPDEVLLLRSGEALRYFAEHRKEAGLTGTVMTGVSRALGDDATFVDDDVKRAREGAGFVCVHCELEAEAERMKRMMGPFGPTAMHWYLSGGIQSLI